MERATWLTDSGQRARAQLLADPERPDRLIAAAAGSTQATVRRIRLVLEAAGQIPRNAQRGGRIPRQPDELAERGLCVTGGHNPDLWTSERNGDRHAAVRICRQCPVREPCETWALRLPLSDIAVYGALMYADRARLVRAQHDQAAG